MCELNPKNYSKQRRRHSHGETLTLTEASAIGQRRSRSPCYHKALLLEQVAKSRSQGTLGVRRDGGKSQEYLDIIPKRQDRLCSSHTSMCSSNQNDNNSNLLQIAYLHSRLGNPGKTLSLEDIYLLNKHLRRRSRRRKSAQIVRDSEDPASRKMSMYRRRLNSANSYQGSRRPSRLSSNLYSDLKDISSSSILLEPRRLSVDTSVSMRGSNKWSPSPLTGEEQRKLMKRRIIVNLIIAVFFSLFLICMLSVIITLTHTSTTTIEVKNSTRNLTYYTFSPVIILDDE